MKLLATWLGKLVVVVAALLLLYTAIGFLLVPVLLEGIAVRGLTRFFGRTVTIRDVAFDPYAMSVTISGLRIDEGEGSAFLSCDTLRANLDPLSSLRDGTWVFREGVLVEPYVSIVRNADGTVSFADLLLSNRPNVPHFRVSLVRLVDGEVALRDATPSIAFSTTIRLLTATVEDLSTNPGNQSSYAVVAVSEAGEKLSLSGVFCLAPLSSHGEITVENVMVSRYRPYFEERSALTIGDGTLMARASYDLDRAQGRFGVALHDGTIAARSFRAYEQGGDAPLVAFAELALTGAHVDLVGQTIQVASIVITGGSAVLRRLPDNSLNVQHVVESLRTLWATRAATSAGWSAAVGEIRLVDFGVEVSGLFGRQTVEWKDLQISELALQMDPPAASVAAITLRDGNLLFTDSSLKPPVRMALSELSIRVGELSSASPWPADLAVGARIDSVALLQVWGETNPINSQGEANVRGLIQNLSLLPLSPYAAKYLGYELTAGKLDLEVTCLVQGRRFSVRSRAGIDHLTLGEKTESKDATALPVRLAIALLTDSSGRITLDVPIQGSLGDPEFGLEKAFTEAVLAPFARAAAFPFSALGAQLGSGSEELGFQRFRAGSAELVALETVKLDTILQGLRRWPELMLDIEGSVDPEEDTGDLRLLAADRAGAVKEYLLHDGTVESGRVFLIDDSLEEVPRKGTRALLFLRDRYHSPM